MERTRPGRRGFTLLEVLIAVVVLAFGLLGVVAVFPAVIDLQRRAQDAVLGGSAAASAEAQLRGSLLESDSLNWTDEPDFLRLPVDRRFPARGVLTLDGFLGFNPLGFGAGAGAREIGFGWQTGWSWPRPNVFPPDASEILRTGTLVLGGGQPPEAGLADLLPNGLPTVSLPVAARLLPDAGSGEEPRYVWDVVVRRVDAGLGTLVDPGSSPNRAVPLDQIGLLPVELAVFIRPIDRGIRVPAGLTLREALSGVREDPADGQASVLEDRDRRFPVTVSGTDLATRLPGAPLDRTDTAYSLPIGATIVPTTGNAVNQPQSRIAIASVFLEDGSPLSVGVDALRASLAQVGQLFIDDLGVVHRVTMVITEETGGIVESIEVEPPLHPRARQIVLTPQVPAAIRVIRTR
jgi:prepilin-type N-terminal cleavage/methylation domain-containing protein